MPESSPLKNTDTGRRDAFQDPSVDFTPSPGTINDSALNMEEAAGGYFDLRETGPRSPDSLSEVAYLKMSSLPSSSAAALAALQSLPVPVLVLTEEKTVIMGNEAMGRWLGINAEEANDDGTMPLSVGEILRGQLISKLGIDILQGGSPIWMKWEDFLDSVVEGGAKAAAQNFGQEDVQSPCSGESTPTTATDNSHRTSSTARKSLSRLSSANLASTTVLDVSVDVIISQQSYSNVRTEQRTAKEQTSTVPLQATMIVSIWSLEDARYFTLTFTSAAPRSTAAASRPSSRTIRSNTSVGHPMTSSSSSSSSRRSLVATNTGTTSSVTSPLLQQPNFPPNGPPTRSAGSSTHSVFQKATQLKDALLNSINMPAYAMWKDESFGIPNKPLLNLMPDTENTAFGDQREFLQQYTLWDEHFKKVLRIDEFPIIELCRSQKGFDARRIGMRHPKTNARIVFEVHGQPIFDERTREFLGGIAVFKDVSFYTKKIAAQIEENERQFEYIANLIPIMVWRTTPSGYHDWFSQRWYDHTGLTEEESIGDGWISVFHPDDIPETQKRWNRSLATGEEYITEYRARRYDGHWRWMLGRAVPFRDDDGKIVKWFGTYARATSFDCALNSLSN